MASMAVQYPARTDTNGTTWYRGETGDGWTADLAQAHPDYRASDAPAPLCATPAHETAPADTTTPTTEEKPAMARTGPIELTEDFQEAPRFTQWMRYPLPPAVPRAESKFNGWGWYQLPSPTTGRPTGYPRASTVAKTLDDTYGLNKWKTREIVQKVLDLARMDPGTVVYDDGSPEKVTAGDLLGLLDEARNQPKVTKVDAVLETIDNCLGGADARELGECVHAWLEALDVGLVLIHQVPEVVKPHVHYARKVMAHRGIVALPQYVERTVLNDQGEEPVAGRIDRIFQLVTTGELVMGDVKSSKSLEYSWLPFGVQVGGVYGWATKMLSIDGKTWEPMPAIRDDFAILLHVPSNQPEKAAAITIDLTWGAETMVASLDARRRRKEAEKLVPQHAVPVPSKEAVRYATARLALSEIASLEEGQAVYETYQDVWDDALGEFAETIAELF
uniref:Exonuclease n=1 Tax=Mycolicibacterium phage phi1_186018 TaxID=3236641 RepID=A0AB39AKQ9_9CAUD